MLTSVNLAISLVIKVHWLPNEVGAPRERLPRRQLHPVFLSIHGSAKNLVAVSGKYAVKLLGIVVIPNLIIDVQSKWHLL